MFLVAAEEHDDFYKFRPDKLVKAEKIDFLVPSYNDNAGYTVYDSWFLRAAKRATSEHYGIPTFPTVIGTGAR